MGWDAGREKNWPSKLLGGAIEAPPVEGTLGGPIVVTPGPNPLVIPGIGVVAAPGLVVAYGSKLP